MIKNPILPGFNPDPSIVRVGEDYFIATSTFEWFPGVQIHHSKDLVNWKLVARPLNRVSQLNMKGNPDSCGVWAPCLSYSDGRFYLVYSNVRSFDGVWKDTPNYLVTTDDIFGEWSEPTYLSSRGFDGSLFHDSNGKKYFTSMLVDHREGKFFGGIELQEFDIKNNKLVGPVHYLHSGTELGKTEGPHIYQKDGFYYLLLAEGGTEYGHAESVLRSTNIEGPYEASPFGPLITASNSPEHPLQKTGHGDLVQSPNGDWYFLFLCSRPLTPLGKCILGRETAIEEVEWVNDWPRLRNGSTLPRVNIPIENHSLPLKSRDEFTDFGEAELPSSFQSLRVPHVDWSSLSERPGFLRIYGKESLTSLHNQALLARRIQHFKIEASTLLEFDPESFLEMAGLVFYYNTGHYHYLHLSKEGNNRVLKIISADGFNTSEQVEVVEIGDSLQVVLKGILTLENLQFSYSVDTGETFTNIGSSLDATILSDDHVRDRDGRYRPAFTGAFVGICCQDLWKNEKHADFDWFRYEEVLD